MAVFVVVNKKRVTVTPRPNAVLSAILASALTKAGVPAGQRSNYALTMNARRVDLSKTLKQAGVRAGCTLEAELAKGGSGKVRVALQVKGGERIACEATGSSAIWDVLVKNEAALGVNLTQADMPFSQPVVQFMQRELASVVELKATTVSSLGAAGGLLRVSFRPTDTSLAEAEAVVESERLREEERLRQAKEKKEEQEHLLLEQRKERKRLQAAAAEKDEHAVRARESQAFQADAPTPAVAVEPTVAEDVEMTERDSKQEAAEDDTSARAVKKKVVRPAPTAKERLVWTDSPATVPRMVDEWAPPPREVTIVSLAAKPSQNLDFAEPEGTHDLTTHDLHALQEISTRKKELRVQMSAAQAKAHAISLYPSVRVLVRFPEGFSLSASFHLKETVTAIVSTVRDFLQPTCPSFKLVSAPRRILNEEAELYQERLYPAAALKLQWDDSPPFDVLGSTGLALLNTQPAANAAIPKTTEKHGSGAPAKSSSAAPAPSGKVSSAGKVPKWLKLGK